MAHETVIIPDEKINGNHYRMRKLLGKYRIEYSHGESGRWVQIHEFIDEHELICDTYRKYVNRHAAQRRRTLDGQKSLGLN